MTTVFGRGFFIATGLLLNLSAGFIAWQVLVGQSVVNGCYYLPLGFALLFQPYQGSCPFNTLPIYFALDFALLLLALGSVTLIVTPKRRGLEIG